MPYSDAMDAASDFTMTDGLFRRLERSLAKGWQRWSLNLEGQDPRRFLLDLVRNLKGTGPDGTDKRIENRHRYVGLGPSLAWISVSKDPTYPIMYDSIEAFLRLWDGCRSALSAEKYHYVSLGIGTGEKDRQVLDRLLSLDDDIYYVPVDISGHMLRLGAVESARRMPGRVLPIEMDFEEYTAIEALRGLLDDLVGDQPILFSLLGNSLANIGDEAEFLRSLSGLFRPQDLFAMEVAITSRLDAEAARAAAEERYGSRAYNEFATAALGMYTDLSIDNNWLKFVGNIEDGHALRVEGFYVNKSGGPLTMMLPNRETIPYQSEESIQVLLGRKYTPDGMRRLLAKCGYKDLAFEQDYSHHLERGGGRSAVFGQALLILEYKSGNASIESPLSNVWSAPHLSSQ
jgi:L-histidine Nalpha-methyltransferase